MDELIKEEIGDVLKRQSHKRLERIVLIAIIVIGILGSAGAINWWHDYQVHQEKLVKHIETVGDDVKGIRKDVSSIRIDVSESRQVMDVVVKQLPPEPQKQAKQIQEIYNQMKKDQTDELWRIKRESSLNPIPDENFQLPIVDKKKRI